MILNQVLTSMLIQKTGLIYQQLLPFKYFCIFYHKNNYKSRKNNNHRNYCRSDLAIINSETPGINVTLIVDKELAAEETGLPVQTFAPT